MIRLEIRKENFRQKLIQYCDQHDPNCVKFPKWLRKDFWDYWTAMNDNGNKMYFEMEKKWSTGLRLATFVKRSQKDPRWKETPKKVYHRPKQRTDEYELPQVDYDRYKANL